jgi:hypothetical protein
MEISACAHVFTITNDLELYCRCDVIEYDHNVEDSNFGYFNVYDVYNAKETALEDIEFNYNGSYESLDDLASDADSHSDKNILSYIPEVIAKECPYCRMIFKRKDLNEDLFNIYGDLEDEYIDRIYYFLDNIPTQWDKSNRYKIPPPINLGKLDKNFKIRKTCSWGSLSSN